MIARARPPGPISGLAAGVLLLGFIPPVSWSAENGWRPAGRVGVEVDGLGERFGSGTLFDTRLPAGGSGVEPQTADEAAEALRFQDQSTRTSGLLELSLARDGRRWFRARGQLLTARPRTQGDLELSAGLPLLQGSLTAGSRLLFQGGPERGGGGPDGLASASWTRSGLPAGLGLKISMSGERSWSSVDSLAGVFDYRVIRPAMELSRSLGPAGGLFLRGGWGRKWTREEAPGAYHERWFEAEWLQPGGLHRGWDLSLRSEDRRYVRGDSLTPSYREISLEGRGELRMPWRMRAILEPELQALEYSTPSDVFQDHWDAGATLRLQTSWRDLTHAEERDPEDISDWIFGLGGRLALLRNRTVRDSDSWTASLLASTSLEGLQDCWWDLSAEAGRRRYRVSGGSRALVYEGLSVSLSGTDYDFLSTSLLGEVELWKKVRLGLFGLLEREVHVDPADDFTLWSLTASLTRSF